MALIISYATRRQDHLRVENLELLIRYVWYGPNSISKSKRFRIFEFGRKMNLWIMGFGVWGHA